MKIEDLKKLEGKSMTLGEFVKRIEDEHLNPSGYANGIRSMQNDIRKHILHKKLDDGSFAVIMIEFTDNIDTYCQILENFRAEKLNLSVIDVYRISKKEN
jgi:hypothetical protein